MPDGVEWRGEHPAPLDWMEAEAHNIAAIVPHAFQAGLHTEVVQLSGAIEILLTSRGQHWLVAGVVEWGLRAARELGQVAAVVRAYQMEARICTKLHLLDRARVALERAEGFELDFPRLESSVREFRGSLELAAGNPVAAVEAFRACLAIDERHGLTRGAGLHARMLAGALVGCGRPGEALPLLAWALERTDGVRNAARVRMVAAQARLALGDPDGAAAELAQARELVARATATQYEVELADLEAQVAVRRGDPEAARARWAWIAQRLWETGDPRFDGYLRRVSALPAPPR